MDTILLAVDGSEHARQAAERAVELAAENGAELNCICVVDQRRFDDPALSSAELVTMYVEDEAALTLTEIAEMATRRDVAIEGDTRHGIPHEVILAYADEIGADVIVVGEHGDHRTHFSGVGNHVKKRAGVDVVVVTDDR
jgi:nucleotide-binding universal stress UspA family protein